MSSGVSDGEICLRCKQEMEEHMQATYGDRKARTTVFAESAAQLALEAQAAETEAAASKRPSVPPPLPPPTHTQHSEARPQFPSPQCSGSDAADALPKALHACVPACTPQPFCSILSAARILVTFMKQQSSSAHAWTREVWSDRKSTKIDIRSKNLSGQRRPSSFMSLEVHSSCDAPHMRKGRQEV